LSPFGYYWFHLADIALHASNGILVWLLVKRLTSDRQAALASSLLFTVSFATVDAVVWSSSRVDLISVFFSLLCLIGYLSYLADRAKLSLALSVIAYTLALAAKGTPVVLPLVLVFLLLQHNSGRQLWKSLIPFMLVTAAYLSALAIKLAAGGKGLAPGGATMPNLSNFAMALSGLFVPERLVAQATMASLITSLFLLTLIVCFKGDAPLKHARLCGLVVLLAGLLPVVALKEFKLATTITDAGYLLSSPSHRIYLASIGMAILYGTFFGELWRRVKWQSAGYALFALLVIWNIAEVRSREKLWAGSASYIRASVEGLAKFKGTIRDDSVVGLVNFPMSRGFMRPVMFLYCGVSNVLLLPMDHIPEAVLDAPEILRYQNRGHFFIYSNQVHDYSPQFNRLLGAAFRHQLAQNRITLQESLTEYLSARQEINNAISENLPR